MLFVFRQKTGTPFWCLLDIVPIKNEKHEVVLYLASHKDITKSKLAQMEEAKDVSESELSVLASDEEPDEPSRPTDDRYQRRRSRAVLYQLSGHYRKSVSMKSKLKLNNVSALLLSPSLSSCTCFMSFFLVLSSSSSCSFTFQFQL